MRGLYLFTFLILLCGGRLTLPAQEICDNLTDDDGDGLVDFGDCDCYSKRGNVWHFGAGYGLDFNGADPAGIFSAIETPEGSSAICDEAGNLLFYSNGGGRLPGSMQNPGYIWNADNEVMYNMMGAEGGGFSAANSCVAVPKPGSATNYYLFTMEESEYVIDGSLPGQEQGRGLSYFEIDMTANGGLGEVVVADERIYTPTWEILVAVEHANGEDYWLIVIRDGASLNREFVVFSVTAAGIEEAGSYPSALSSEFFFYTKASPDKSKLVEWSQESAAFYDFDPAAGTISNRVRVPLNGIFRGAFSPSGRYFYAVQVEDFFETEKPVYRVAMEGLAPGSAFQQIGAMNTNSFFPFTQWQPGPDGNIYFLFEQSFLGRIECPDTDNPAIVPQLLSLSGNPDSEFFGRSLGMPNFPNHFFYRPYIELELTGQPQYEWCPGDTLTLEVTASKCADFTWSTGEAGRSIQVAAPGTYSVTATDDCETRELAIEVISIAPGAIAVEAPGSVCAGSAVDLTADLPGALSWAWQTPSGVLLSDTSNLSLTVTRDTALQVVADSECGEITAPVNIQAVAFPDPDLQVNNAGCDGPLGSAEMANALPSWTIFWRDAAGVQLSSGSAVEGLPPGDYQAAAFTIAGNGACQTVLDFSVAEAAPFAIGAIEVTDNPCPGQNDGQLAVAEITGTPPYTIEWRDEAGAIISTQSTAASLADGNYTLRVEDAAGCSQVQTVTLTSPILPAVTFTVEPEQCAGSNGAISIALSPPVDLTVLLDGQTIDPAALSGLPAGNYPVAVVSTNNCLLADTVLTVENFEPFDLSGDTLLTVFRGVPSPVVLSGLPGLPLAYSWSPAFGLSCTDCRSPLITLEDDQRYSVAITEPAGGCTGIYTVEVVVRPPEEVFVPTAFSPNGDGINDRFRIFPSDPGLVLESLQVFDR